MEAKMYFLALFGTAWVNWKCDGIDFVFAKIPKDFGTLLTLTNALAVIGSFIFRSPPYLNLDWNSKELIRAFRTCFRKHKNEDPVSGLNVSLANLASNGWLLVDSEEHGYIGKSGLYGLQEVCWQEMAYLKGSDEMLQGKKKVRWGDW